MGSIKRITTAQHRASREYATKSVISGPRQSGPKSTRILTTREKIILLQGSKLHGCTFPPWTPPDPSDFEAPQYEDPGRLSLSSMQLDVFDGWRRPTEVARTLPNVADNRPTMISKDSIDLVQDITTDCSVVASLCAASARLDTGQSDVLLRNVFPQDHTLGHPVLSHNGKYIVRLYFNGCPRRVIIDDRLPASRTTRALHVLDRQNPSLLWPALVEKAYLKVRGGYDFPGSNSGTDLWVLTGWIPEQLFIHSDDIVRNALWRRLFAAFKYGDVLITMGTGKLTPSEEEGMGLVGEHDYAVMHMKEIEGEQLVLIKNPWSEGTVWKGSTYPIDAMNDLSASLDQFDVKEAAVSHDRSSLAPGTFWMTLTDVFQSFESIYLNWNPSLFGCKEDVHFDWDLSLSDSPQGSLIRNPQFTIKSKTEGIVWLLLNRHFTSKQEISCRDLEARPSDEDEPGFISMYAFDNSGERVASSDGATHQSPYVDSPNSLLKVELPAGKVITVVVSEQSLPRTCTPFTLSAFSLSPIDLSEPRDKCGHSVSLPGKWTGLTAGGNASGPTYHVNPQFSLTLGETSDLFILLEIKSKSLPVHVKLVHAKARRVYSITSKDVLGDSGEYRKGFAFATLRCVPRGLYTLVCSTFEQGQPGAFVLHVRSSSPCKLEKIAITSAGRFVTQASLANFEPENSRLVAPLISRRLNRVSMTARSRGDNSGTYRNLYSPFKLLLEDSQGLTIQSTKNNGDAEYSDGCAGVYFPEVDIQPSHGVAGRLWIVLDRLACSGIQIDEFVEVEVFSDEPIEIGKWQVIEKG